VRWIADYACCTVLLNLAIAFGILGVGIATLPLEIETSFDSFLITDVESSIKYNAYENALDSRAGYTQSRRLAATQIYMSKDLYVYYELTGKGLQLTDGLFHSKAISAISKFENSLIELPGWQTLCREAANESKGLCDPGMTLLRYVVPTQVFEGDSLIPSEVTLDAKGYEAVETVTAIELMEQDEVTTLFLPEELEITNDVAPTAVRTSFRFRLPCCTSADSMASRRASTNAFKTRWENFVIDEVLPLLLEGADELEGEKFINVWYSASDIDSIEVKVAIMDDLVLVALALAYVHVYLFVHTRSILLSLLGPLVALSSVPLTFIFCAVGLDATTVSFANFLALFLIVGFGADVIFVYQDFWDSSHRFHKNIPDRLYWTYRQAIYTSLATTGTTALSFLANLASVIRALRQFGFFMGVCVMLAWVLVGAIYAPLLVFDLRCHRRVRRCWASIRGGTAKKVETSGGWKARLFVKWLRFSFRFRHVIFLLTVLLLLGGVGVSLPAIKVSTELPSIFPAEHNDNAGQATRDLFEAASTTFSSSFDEPETTATVCQEPMANGVNSGCSINWCEAAETVDETTTEWAGSGTCRCFRRELTSSCSSYAYARQRFVGPSSLTTSQLINGLQPYLTTTKPDNYTLASGWTQDPDEMPSTLIQEWETGITVVRGTCDLTVRMVRSDTSTCGWDDYCFCGSQRVCSLGSDWQEVSETLTIPVATDDRRLAVASAKQLKVYTVFGLQVPTTVKLLGQEDTADTWDFLTNFDLRQPWSQRNLFKFCDEWPDALKVASSWCWMRDFRTYSRSSIGRFPTRTEEFVELSADFVVNSGSSTRGTRYIWQLGGEIKAIYVSVSADFSKNAGTTEMLAFKALWDAYVDDWNNEAFVTARGAFHVSEGWVTAESQGELISSTVQTLAILFGLAFLAMFAFTKSCTVSMYVVVATFGVVCGLVFFMIRVNAWEIGLIEVVAIIYFIGYALDYSLHIAFKYCSDDAMVQEKPEPFKNKKSVVRFQRTAFALKSMGSAVMGSAATTAGSSFFLVFCSLTFFTKLGAMCLTVTLLSVIIALGPLPAALMAFGPVRPGCRCCRRNHAAEGSAPKAAPRE